MKTPLDKYLACRSAGEQSALDYFNGSAGALLVYLADRESPDEHIRDMARLACSGFAWTSARIFDAIRNSKLATFTPDPPSSAHIEYLLARAKDGRIDDSVVDGMIAAINAYKIRFPHVTANKDAPVPAERPAPSVQKVEIISLPERTTTTTVSRDVDQEISCTTSVERNS